MSPAADTCHTRAQRPAHQPAGNWGLCTCTQTSPRPQTHMPTETRHHNKHAPLPKKQRPHHQKLSWQNKPGLYEGQHKFINGGGRVLALSAQAVGSQCKNASQPFTHKTQDTGPELPIEQPDLHHPNTHQPNTHQKDIEVVRPTVPLAKHACEPTKQAAEPLCKRQVSQSNVQTPLVTTRKHHATGV
jgi:hypothetical protein